MAPPPAPDPRTARRREDLGLIFLAKGLRAAAYGALSGFLFLYLADDLGFSTFNSLAVTSLTLIGAAAWNLVALAPLEHRLGRRRTIALFAGLFVLSATLLFLSADPYVVLAAVFLGGVSASTADNGPLASLDQAILPSVLSRRARTRGFAVYHLIAYYAAAGGALLLVVPGALAPHDLGFLPSAPHAWILLIYLVLALTTWVTYAGLSDAVEVSERAAASPPPPLPAEVRGHVRALALLFGVDAFAGGLVINPVLTAFFVVAWHQGDASIGLILSLAGAVAGTSFLFADPIARRIGLLRTMVVTHLPSNVLLLLVPLMPSFPLALAMLLGRSALSQMDVPTRQSYTMSLVDRRDRPRVAGTLAGARGVAQSAGPFPAVAFDAAGLLAAPFLLGGGLKIVYDLVLYRRFRGVRVPDEDPTATSSDATRRG
ncbi:MAG: MFS transporter [Thermoplasmata archaeon]